MTISSDFSRVAGLRDRVLHSPSRLRGRGRGRVFFFLVVPPSFLRYAREMYPVRRQISPHAARLRRERTDVEDVIWQALRNRQCDGFKFRFQSTIGAFVVDFLCIEARLIVELDGGQHNAATDFARTRFLEARGYRVLRFWNGDVVENRNGVLEAIRLALAARMAERRRPSPNPSRESGRGMN